MKWAIRERTPFIKAYTIWNTSEIHQVELSWLVFCDRSLKTSLLRISTKCKFTNDKTTILGKCAICLKFSLFINRANWERWKVRTRKCIKRKPWPGPQTNHTDLHVHSHFRLPSHRVARALPLQTTITQSCTCIPTSDHHHTELHVHSHFRPPSPSTHSLSIILLPRSKNVSLFKICILSVGFRSEITYFNFELTQGTPVPPPHLPCIQGQLWTCLLRFPVAKFSGTLYVTFDCMHIQEV